jgi:N-acetylneuraminic acid mutarotase
MKRGRANMTDKITLIAVMGIAMMALLTCCEVDGPNGNDNGPQELAILESFDPATGAWDSLASMNEPRSVAAAEVINGRLYVVGGSDLKRGKPYLNVLEEYNPSTDQWVRKASMRVKRDGPGAAVLDGKLYVFGGAQGRLYKSSMEIYDPATDSWTDGPSMNIARFCPAVGIVDGKIVVAGGVTEGVVDIADTEIFDPILNTWLGKLDMPTARGQAMAGVVNDTLYVLGGFSEQRQVTGVVESYPSSGVWQTGYAAMLSGGRAEAGFGVINDVIYIAGGLYETPSTKSVLGSLLAYDPATDSWQTGLTDMPTPRSEPAAAVINGKLYVVGGYVER